MDDDEIDRLLAELGVELPDVEEDEQDGDTLPRDGLGFEWWGDDDD